MAKLNQTGSALAYATFLGGSREDGGLGIVVDGAGSAYVTGVTWSDNFPTTPGAFDPYYNGGNTEAFVIKLDPIGNALTYATFLGGRNGEYGYAIAVDGSGCAYMAGNTSS